MISQISIKSAEVHNFYSETESLLSFVKNLGGPDAGLPSPIKKIGKPTTTSSPKVNKAEPMDQVDSAAVASKLAQSALDAVKRVKNDQSGPVAASISEGDDLMESDEGKDASKQKPSSSKK